MTKEEKENIIKYLEDKINTIIETNKLISGKDKVYMNNRKVAYQDILERIKNNNYE